MFVFQSQSFNCVEKTKCPGSNVSSVQIQGDADYFINHLGVPATQFSYEDINKSEVVKIKIKLKINNLKIVTHRVI